MLARSKRSFSSLLGVGLSLFLGFLAGVLLLGAATAGTLYEYEDTVDPSEGLPEVDVIVVLAGARGRIDFASQLWHLYWKRARVATEFNVPMLYFSGLGPNANWSVVTRQVGPEVMADLKPEHVVIETDSENTVENALWLERNAVAKGWSRMVLVTSSYHMKRAAFIFDWILNKSEDRKGKKPFEIETYSIYQEPFLPQQWRHDLYGIRVTLIEYLKWAYYRAVL